MVTGGLDVGELAQLTALEGNGRLDDDDLACCAGST